MYMLYTLLNIRLVKLKLHSEQLYVSVQLQS